MHPGKPLLHHALDGPPLLLHLPAEEVRAVVRKGDLDVALSHGGSDRALRCFARVHGRPLGGKPLDFLPHLLVDLFRVVENCRGPFFDDFPTPKIFAIMRRAYWRLLTRNAASAVGPYLKSR